MELLLSLFLHTFNNQTKSPRGDPCHPCIKYTFSTWLAYHALGQPGTGSTKPVLVSLVFETQQCLKQYSHPVSFLSHLRVSLSSSSGYLVLLEKSGNDVPVLIFYFLCKSLLRTDLCFLSGWLCGKLTSSHPPWNESASQRLKRELASFCLQLSF